MEHLLLPHKSTKRQRTRHLKARAEKRMLKTCNRTRIHNASRDRDGTRRHCQSKTTLQRTKTHNNDDDNQKCELSVDAAQRRKRKNSTKSGRETMPADWEYANDRWGRGDLDAVLPWNGNGGDSHRGIYHVDEDIGISSQIQLSVYKLGIWDEYHSLTLAYTLHLVNNYLFFQDILHFQNQTLLRRQPNTNMNTNTNTNTSTQSSWCPMFPIHCHNNQYDQYYLIRELVWSVLWYVRTLFIDLVSNSSLMYFTETGTAVQFNAQLRPGFRSKTVQALHDIESLYTNPQFLLFYVRKFITHVWTELKSEIQSESASDTDYLMDDASVHAFGDCMFLILPEDIVVVVAEYVFAIKRQRSHYNKGGNGNDVVARPATIVPPEWIQKKHTISVSHLIALETKLKDAFQEWRTNFNINNNNINSDFLLSVEAIFCYRQFTDNMEVFVGKLYIPCMEEYFYFYAFKMQSEAPYEEGWFFEFSDDWTHLYYQCIADSIAVDCYQTTQNKQWWKY